MLICIDASYSAGDGEATNKMPGSCFCVEQEAELRRIRGKREEGRGKGRKRGVRLYTNKELGLEP
jgi:hypothetical protein